MQGTVLDSENVVGTALLVKLSVTPAGWIGEPCPQYHAENYVPRAPNLSDWKEEKVEIKTLPFFPWAGSYLTRAFAAFYVNAGFRPMEKTDTIFLRTERNHSRTQLTVGTTDGTEMSAL